MAEKFKKMTTTAGVAVFPHLHAPDTRFAEGGAGLWQTKLTLKADAAQPFTEAIDAAIEEAVETVQKAKGAKTKIKRANPPYVVDDETGDVTFHFKRNASYKKDGEEKPMSPMALFDAKGKKLTYGTRIGAGSEMKVNFSIMPFPNYTPTIGAGVKLGLEAAQITTLREFGGASADKFGFDVTPDEEPETPLADDTEGSDDF